MTTILGNLRQLYQKLRERNSSPSVERSSEVNILFRFKYSKFKDLLSANTKLLNVLSDLDEKMKGDKPFGFSYVTGLINNSLNHAFMMAKCLNVMGNKRYQGLYSSLEKIRKEITAITNELKSHPPPSNVLPYTEITISDADWVGGKSANLGEISNKLGVPVPRGFSITTKAFHTFIEYNDLQDEIDKLKNLTDIDEYERLDEITSHLFELIQSKSLPPGLQEEFSSSCLQYWGDNFQSLRVSMRSSALGEDGELSYAGQYLTILAVNPHEIPEAYKKIIASLYSTRSVSYRASKGVFDENLAMAVACLEMVNSVASGVLYTRHPFDVLNDNILINAVYGLGPYAVDGVITPDTYTVSKEEPFRVVKKDISTKTVQLIMAAKGGVEEITVPEEQQHSACLTDEQIIQLAQYGVLIEKHYNNQPQDIEWALAPDGTIFILQARPFKIQNQLNHKLLRPDPIAGHTLLIDNCEIASQGVGSGPVFQVESLEDLANFPPGGILIAQHSSPEYVVVMRKCSAIIVQAGSVSGHMAALAREFNVPTLITGQPLLPQISPGTTVTIDAYTGRVYDGKVSDLLNAITTDQSHLSETSAFLHLKRVAKYITPLNLINPNSSDFSPEGCRTLHDIARFCHEKSYTEMFHLSDIASKFHGWSLRLDATLPVDIHIIDLGNGLKADAVVHRGCIKTDQIQAGPFLALLDGLLNKEVSYLEPRPITFSGLLSVMKEQTLTPGHIGQRFGDRSYAIIADKYLNFSSRVGYHYSVVDAYCGETINKNYISFSFNGGAADPTRKNRRVRTIALILEQEGFKVVVKADKVDARLQKYPASYINGRLEMLGRLLIFTRQLDMLMNTESCVEWAAANFTAGNYTLNAPKDTPD